MKRMVVVFVLVVGALIGGATNVSAGTYCSLDPTVGAGVPLVKYSVDVKVLGSTAYASGTGSSTTFGGGVYVP